jgi:DNA polymerase-3 subunit epsilon
MVQYAPTIEDIMDDIMFHLNGKTIVSHNLDYILSFLTFEFDRILKLKKNFKGVCTLQLSQLVEPNLPARNLDCLCDYFDLVNYNSHTAFGDCKVTYELFGVLKNPAIKLIGESEFERNYISPLDLGKSAHPGEMCFKRSDAGKLNFPDSNKLRNLISRLPSNPSYELPVQQYLNILDTILADRILTRAEAEGLFDFAQEFNISKSQAVEIHHEYLRKLTRVYLLDNIITDIEDKDLDKVRQLLLISKEILDKIKDFEKAKIAKEQTDQLFFHREVIGKSVCFEGELKSRLDGIAVSKSLAQQLAMERGMIIKARVGDHLDYLVVADPNVQNENIDLARKKGITVLAEAVFWNMLGISVE